MSLFETNEKIECEHGVSLNGHCPSCAAEHTDWIIAPISDEEISRMESCIEFRYGPVRIPADPRNYHALLLFPVLMMEYKKLRADAAKRATEDGKEPTK